MLFAKKLLVLFFVFQCANVLRAQINSSCSVGADIKTCNSSVTLESKSLLPGSWEIVSGTGTFSALNSSMTNVSALPEGVSTFAWSNNDKSCYDTISVIIPKMGITSVSFVGTGKINTPTECKVSFGSTLKLNTIGSVLPPSVGLVSSVAYFLYTCQPPLIPDVIQDACANKGTFENINNSKNDGALVLRKPVTNQTYWAVPVLSNDITLQGPQVDQTCQKTGAPIKFTLLNDISFTIKDNCKDGISEIVFFGGDAEFFGSKLTISNIVSKKAIFSSTSLNHGEKLTITDLVNGETISFDVTDALGYKINFSYLFPPCPACITTIGYNANYCRYDSIAKPIFYNNSGIGRLQVTPSAGLVWDVLTGIVDVKKSVPGNYSVKNITSKSCVKQDSSFCTLVLSDSVPVPVSPASETLCMPNPKVGNITSVVAQLITWYDKVGNKLNPEIDPVFDGETYFSTQTINGCESKKVPIKVIAPKVSPPIADAVQFVCKENKPTLANLEPKNGKINWYLTPSGGNALPTTHLLLETKYYATITLNCESQKRLEVSVKFDTPSPPIITKDTLFYCDSKTLTIDSLVPFGKQFVWYSKSTDILALKPKTKLEQGTYYVSYLNTATNCQSSKEKIRVFVTEILANVEVLEPDCEELNGMLISTPSQGSFPYVFKWSNGSDNSSAEKIAAGNYTLTITDTKGCQLDTVITVDCRKKISSILTPNGDGKNDVWVVGYSNRYPAVKVLVFNRWGSLVYESAVPYMDDWDGKSNVLIDQQFVPSGTYFYQIYKTSEGSPETGYIEVVK